MGSFSGYMQYIQGELGKSWCKGAEKDADATVCGLSSSGEPQGIHDYGNRWIGILGKDAVMLKNIAQAAKIICNSVDTWAANLQVDEGAGRWGQSRCKSEELGIQGRTAPKSSCDWRAKQALWYLNQGLTELRPDKPEQRSLMVCMDIVSIILGIFGNARKGKDEYEYKQKNLCQAVYEAFSEWGGEEVATSLMDFWFPANTGGIILGRKSMPQETGHGGTWRNALYIRPRGITSIQCSLRQPGPPRTYSTSCYWTKDSSGCENYNDEQWTAAEEWKLASKVVSENELSELIQRHEDQSSRLPPSSSSSGWRLLVQAIGAEEYFIQVVAGTVGGLESDMSSNKKEFQRVLPRFMISGKNQPQRCKNTAPLLSHAWEGLNHKLAPDQKRKQRR
ncbi:hypothetical protein C922_05134 [Plasmodium inui San Antonio 1]|uniref:Uncharacterized protein n=1 Tax=Plasmodium inui San Antonio 1 TaxID=1237626 RepID=W7A5Y0_9APIC|nr:hypothetical protein C922_05134 [Plasmodium inui San Antonio 1]EUD64494.1 hypothetical protein C922_05134 [Plasmodium inui San Antonio 1]